MCGVLSIVIYLCHDSSFFVMVQKFDGLKWYLMIETLSSALLFFFWLFLLFRDFLVWLISFIVSRYDLKNVEEIRDFFESYLLNKFDNGVNFKRIVYCRVQVLVIIEKILLGSLFFKFWELFYWYINLNGDLLMWNIEYEYFSCSLTLTYLRLFFSAFTIIECISLFIDFYL